MYVLSACVLEAACALHHIFVAGGRLASRTEASWGDSSPVWQEPGYGRASVGVAVTVRFPSCRRRPQCGLPETCTQRRASRRCLRPCREVQGSRLLRRISRPQGSSRAAVSATRPSYRKVTSRDTCGYTQARSRMCVTCVRIAATSPRTSRNTCTWCTRWTPPLPLPPTRPENSSERLTYETAAAQPLGDVGRPCGCVCVGRRCICVLGMEGGGEEVAAAAVVRAAAGSVLVQGGSSWAKTNSLFSSRDGRPKKDSQGVKSPSAGPCLSTPLRGPSSLLTPRWPSMPCHRDRPFRLTISLIREDTRALSAARVLLKNST